MRLVLLEQRANVGTAILGWQCAPVKPDFDEGAVVAEQFGEHLLADFSVAGLFLRVVAFASIYLAGVADFEIVAVYEVTIDAGFYAIFSAGFDEVSYEITFAVSPARLFESEWVGVALPLEEACAVLGGQDGVFRPHRFCGSDPLVCVEFFGVVEVGGDVFPVPLLHVLFEGPEIVVDEHADFEVLPGRLFGCGLGEVRLCGCSLRSGKLQDSGGER